MVKPAREPLPQLHRPSPVQPGGRSKQRQAADGTVSSSKVAAHLDLTYQRVLQLADEHVLERLPNGRFNLRDCRLRYIRWLRAPERRSQKSKADNDFAHAKAELIRIRIAEKTKMLIPTEKAVADMELVIGCFITKLSSIAPRIARLAGNSLVVRREIDAIVYETRKELAHHFNRLADEAGEPPFEDKA